MTLFGTNVYAQSNKDVSIDDKNDNARQQSVQKIINEELNAPLPNTNQDTALIPNIASRNKKNDDGSNWGENSNAPYVAYRVENAKTGEKPIGNCEPGTDNKGEDMCASVAGKEVGNQDKFVIPAKEDLVNGFYVPETEVRNMQGTGDYKNYFYRYWTNGTCPKGGPSSCWSASYPIICLPGITGKVNEEIVTMSPEDAKNYFGFRMLLGDNGADLSEKLVQNGYFKPVLGKKEVSYRMGVNFAASEANAKGQDTSGSGSVKVARWTIDENNGCLVPEFIYSNHVVDGYEKTAVLAHPNELSQNSSLDTAKKLDDILPCGMYVPDVLPSGFIWKTNAKTGVKQLGCTGTNSDISDATNMEARANENTKEAFALVTKGAGEDQYWTRYKIGVPKIGGEFKSTENYKDYAGNESYLNVRACANCEPAANHCQQIIHGLIEMGNVDGCTCVADVHKVKTVNGVIDSTNCRDDNAYSDSLNVTYRTSAPVRHYSCTTAGIDNLVKALITGTTFDLEGYSGAFKHKLSCSVCLNKLESDLKTLFLNN